MSFPPKKNWSSLLTHAGVNHGLLDEAALRCDAPATALPGSLMGVRGCKRHDENFIHR